jgi:hypothetical protein
VLSQGQQDQDGVFTQQPTQHKEHALGRAVPIGNSHSWDEGFQCFEAG